MLFDANNGIANVYERDEVQSLKKRFHMEILEQCNICIFVAQVWKNILGV